MKYVIMFHGDDENHCHIETLLTDARPEIQVGDFITIEKDERYKIVALHYNHNIYLDKINIYAVVAELTSDEKSFIECFTG